MPTVSVSFRRDYDFGNLHTDFQSVSFLALVKAVQQRTREIVQLNGEGRIWSLAAFLRPRTSLNEVSSGLQGTALARSQGSSTHKGMQ